MGDNSIILGWNHSFQWNSRPRRIDSAIVWSALNTIIILTSDRHQDRDYSMLSWKRSFALPEGPRTGVLCHCPAIGPSTGSAFLSSRSRVREDATRAA